MAIGDFYTQVSFIAIGAIALLTILWKHHSDAVDKLEKSANQEEFVLSSHIWATNIKKSVEDFVSFIQANILRLSESDPKSQDKYEVFFSEKESLPTLKDRLDRLDKSYNAYLTFNNLLPELIQQTEKLVIWIVRTICVCFAFAIWGAIGFLTESNEFFTAYTEYFWASLVLVVFAACVSLWGITKQNRRCGTIKSTLRREKAKYGSIIGERT